MLAAAGLAVIGSVGFAFSFACTITPAPAASAATSARLAIDVSPRAVMASALCAAPYSTALCRFPVVKRP